MIGLSGIALFLFGNKLNEDSNVINAGGVRKEFEIAQGTGVAVLPIGVTGYMAKELAEEMLREPGKSFTQYPWLEKEVARLLDPAIDRTKINQDILSILKKLGG
ncbi:hypothetical protein U876_07595 [Aeromonas hydrophila NJ-35]|nr:hypothetical protein AHML_14985 [Aeromonas hydrophila ML09-119]AHX33416.1 hypothetical protein V428_15490 [Aeromonas hydrophila subsp. hydrophila AL09-71]AHX70217.1 hypothetical protein V429_15520 [Aeromonas hydrophila pc104A]AJE35771.1 hypothetical protein V469_07625 [Aeromonas hydrophila J-1]AKJ33968.1 hypothetical protein U876_07595 [Aeromonas hydrophila NJ-35]ALQ62810.1 hypothetical protein AS145_07875 [Aeromonas hydrophila]